MRCTSKKTPETKTPIAAKANIAVATNALKCKIFNTAATIISTQDTDNKKKTFFFSYHTKLWLCYSSYSASSSIASLSIAQAIAPPTAQSRVVAAQDNDPIGSSS